MENNVSLKTELSKSISYSRVSVKETLERLQFLVSNFNGSQEHTRAIEFVEGCLSVELSTLKQLNKAFNNEVRPPSIFKKILIFLGFNSNYME